MLSTYTVCKDTYAAVVCCKLLFHQVEEMRWLWFILYGQKHICRHHGETALFSVQQLKPRVFWEAGKIHGLDFFFSPPNQCDLDPNSAQFWNCLLSAWLGMLTLFKLYVAISDQDKNIILPYLKSFIWIITNTVSFLLEIISHLAVQLPSVSFLYRIKNYLIFPIFYAFAWSFKKKKKDGESQV